MKKFPEKDWKRLRSLKADTLSLACDRIFKKVEKISNTRNGKEHKAFLDLWKLIKKEDYEISLMFDDMKRSNAFHKLTAWKRNAIISKEDFSKFTKETQQSIEVLLGIMR